MTYKKKTPPKSDKHKTQSFYHCYLTCINDRSLMAVIVTEQYRVISGNKNVVEQNASNGLAAFN